MYIRTSVGSFDRSEFIEKCNEGSFPNGLQVGECLDLRCMPLTSLPEGLQVSRWLDLDGCGSLMSLPKGMIIGGFLDIRRCTSLTELPDGLQVGGNLYVDQSLIEQYPFRDIPKVLHLPLNEGQKQILLERLQGGH